MARPTTPVVLSIEDEKILNERISSSKSPQRDVLRARIVLECATGWSNKAIAKSLNTSEQTVCLWRKRFAQKGLAGLEGFFATLSGIGDKGWLSQLRQNRALL
jgi:hypothetical protein